MQVQWPAEKLVNRINSKRDDSHSEVIMIGSQKSEKFVIVFSNEEERKKWLAACKQIKPDKYLSIKISKNLPIESFLEANRTMFSQGNSKISSGKSTISRAKGRLSILMDTEDVLTEAPKVSKLVKSSSQLDITEQLAKMGDVLDKKENQVSIHDLAGKNDKYSAYISNVDLGNGWSEIKLNNGLVYYENSETREKSFEHPLGAIVIKRSTNSLRERPSIQSMFETSQLSFGLDAGLSVIDEKESDVMSIIGSIASRPTYASEVSVFDLGHNHEWVKVVQPDGTLYYSNKRTGETRWNLFD
eukprot:NODE_34_length_31639_cov_0.254375.p9 type:complete len:301 gc:universal NODE_34_length_31639_cov_0.254375:8953-8051(-)